ncbi:MAG: winged helix-turn-helix domain-containing protein [Methanobrevibacter sp.]|uniref:winged helix-turn-helix domain-containing protein n=1 Tax=Methanobrevibacter sp. TaxID=66852 RepID=UPI003F0F1DA5
MLNAELISMSKIKNKELSSLLIARKGGITTIKITDQILYQPSNANQLSKILQLDYKTITYHLNLMIDHKFIEKEKITHSYIYYPSKKLYKYIEEYNLIKNFLKIK